ncbi:hypothetical protein LshimejAT787_0904370 [Lyophyllum shimeji]|uniref:Uncharacterized protein n=1 Tax=Lyophyllum shimeji TaxID=47721 RepID=A0A9P3PTU3_LYOSH|nr:hypothetical protein LshimejAT787_0904370 [Lyophyllum shimeji]
MTRNANEKPGKLLSYRDARRSYAKAYVYGFPLDNAGVEYCGNKIKPIPSDATGDELQNARLKQAEAISKHLVTACAAEWPLPRLRTVLGYREGTIYTLVALAACTRPHLDQFIPPRETLEKLREIMADNGFREEPQWFLMTS